MKHMSRVGGFAAALLALAATTASAGPSVASAAAAVPVAGLAGHVTAWVPDDRAMDEIVSPNTATEFAASVARQGMTKDDVDQDSGVSLEARRAIRVLVQAHAASSVSDPEQECLAGAVYFEAQGEPLEGQLAVAEVVLNRAASGEYPSSICDVVTQPDTLSSDVLWYHADYVAPSWGRRLDRVTQIGAHIFYRRS